MATTNFVDRVTPINATWLNDVDSAVYETVPRIGRNIAEFGAVGDGITDDLTPLTNFFNSAIANPGVPHVLNSAVYATSAALPTINVSNVCVYGVAQPAIHEYGTPVMRGSVIKWIGSAGGTVQTISAINGASNQRLSGITYEGIAIDCNSLAAYGLVVKSIRESKIDVAIANATTAGLYLDVVATLGESPSLQKTKVNFAGRQVEAPNAVSLMIGPGTATANVSMNDFWADIQHHNNSAIVTQNADNNDWRYVRTTHSGTATEAISWQGAATSGTATRGERYHFLTGTLTSQAYGTGTYTAPAVDITVYCLDSENSTPTPIVATGASVYYSKSTTPFGDSPWTAYTPTVTASSGTLTSVSAVGRYLKRGRIVHVDMTITLTTNGTGSGALRATLPFSEAGSSGWVFSGHEASATGATQSVLLQAGLNYVQIKDYAGIYSGGNGRLFFVTGFYEIA